INKWDSEILYVSSLPAGLGSNDVGLDRGKSDGGLIVKFSRVGKKVFMVQPNYDFRASSNDEAERRAVEQSFAQSTIWSFSVWAETDNRVLVDATSFLLRDATGVSQTLRRMQQGSFVEDSNRSAIYLPRTKNFPFNTEIEATVSFVNQDGVVGSFVQSVTPSPQYITLRMHHSFVQLPDGNYKPRVFDPRSSFIPVSFFDYSSPVSEPIAKYFIRRHRLEKKDPKATRSEAIKPIVYYLDNGTPEPIRSALLEGASWWNQAFEAAGFINAFQVKILPDTADPMDIRYNMINWVHRSTRGWSYGGGVTDPRTGEIIKGQVTLGSLRVRQDYLIAQGLLAPFEKGIPADDQMLKMALSRLKQLSAHEVGHTLGLMHNYASSVNDRASVMDYPHPMVRLTKNGKMNFSEVYDDKIGTWDKIAINWGYHQWDDPSIEKKELDKILDEAEAKGMQFISDQDARAPGGLHPTAHLWDNGKDAATELNEVIHVRTKALSQFGQANLLPGMPMAMLEDVLVPVYFYHRYQTEAACKLIGGMSYTYALNRKSFSPMQPLSKEVQLNALNIILKTIQPTFLQIPDHIVKLIPPRPAGYPFGNELFRKRTGLAFDPLAPAETAADLPFSFLFHPERISRMATHSEKGLSLAEMTKRVIDITWKSDREKGELALIQQQTEQVLLTYLLASSIDEKASFAARSVIRKTLDDLKLFIEEKRKGSEDEILTGH
ncbi:MAG: zinc-dependent metalloprotease, partial [Sphingobacteriales bacterium]